MILVTLSGQFWKYNVGKCKDKMTNAENYLATLHNTEKIETFVLFKSIILHNTLIGTFVYISFII